MVSSQARAIDAFYDVVIDGEVDIDTAGRVRARLDQARGSGAPTVVLDTSGVTFIDCFGLRELVAGRAELTATGRTLYLRDPSPAVARLLQLTGLAASFGLHEAPHAAPDPGRGPGTGGARLQIVPPTGSRTT